MKHLRFLPFLLAAWATITPIAAQDSLTLATALNQVVPADTAIRRGTLANGMTYIVRRATSKAGMAEFRLVQRTGSLVEEDNERGMAHLLEHLLFRGTKHFPGTSILDFMRRNGVAFGPDVNAQTTIEHTIYMLANVPIEREGLADSCLLALRDWSADATLSPEALEAERPIVIEEWRRGAQVSSISPNLSEVYGQCHYCERHPIGDTAVIRSYTIGQMQNFYRKWYQPQNQCVIVVGDFEADAMVAKIKTLFGDLSRGETRVPEYELPHVSADGPHVTVVRDSTGQLPFAFIQLEWVVPETPLAEMNKLRYFVEKQCYETVSKSLRERMKRLAEADANILTTWVEWEPFLVSSRANSFMVGAVVAANDWQSSVRTVMTEVERLRRNGLTSKELSAIHSKKSYDNPWAKEDSLHIDWTPPETRDPDDIHLKIAVTNCVEHYLKGTIGIAPWSYNVIQRFCNERVSREVVGQCLARIFSTRDLFVRLVLPDGTGELPTSGDLTALMDEVRHAEIAADTTLGDAGTSAINHMTNPHRAAITPTAGRIVRRTTLADTSRTEFLLSNGVRVIWENRPEQNNVDMRAFLPGGYSRLESDEVNFMACHDWVKKVKQISKIEWTQDEIRYNLGRLRWYDDADSVFMEIYSRLAHPEIDTAAFNTSVSTLRQSVPALKMPQVEAALRGRMFTARDEDVELVLRSMADVDAVNIGHLQQVIGRLHNNYNGLVVVMQGRYDEAKCPRLFETYLASLPSQDEPYLWTDKSSYHCKAYDDLDSVRVKGSGVPIADVFMHVNQEQGLTYSASQAIHYEALRSVMNQVLINTIRLKHNDIYSIEVQATSFRHPFVQQNYAIHFTCPPDKAMRIVADVRDALHAMAHGDAISQTIVDSFVNHSIKRAKSSKASSIDDLLNEYLYDGQWANPKDFDLLHSVTVESLRSYTKALLDLGHIQTYIVRAE